MISRRAGASWVHGLSVLLVIAMTMGPSVSPGPGGATYEAMTAGPSGDIYLVVQGRDTLAIMDSTVTPPVLIGHVTVGNHAYGVDIGP